MFNFSVHYYIERTFDVDCKKLYMIRRRSKLNNDKVSTTGVHMKNHIDYVPKARHE